MTALANAEAARKLGSTLTLTKEEIPGLRGVQNKSEWISLALLAFSALLWGRQAGEHEYISTYSKKGQDHGR